ncbi:MAG TPA: DnaD domain protein [Anaerolineales bacterium]|nr:DnaD domain protein [Anaerolineales bacterium]
MSFNGFPAGKVRFTPIPGPFFSELLPQVDHLGELKVILYALWRLDRMEGIFRFLRRTDFLEDESFLQGLGAGQAADLEESLERCLRRGTLLHASLDLEDGEEHYYFLNSPKGRAAVEALNRGEWRPSGDPQAPFSLETEPPNIFRLYEENFGPLTPLIAESLRDAETTFPASWIEDAIRLAVENNVRRWSYVAAILNRWQDGGRDDRKDRRDTEKDRRRYIDNEYSDLIEH